MDELENDQLALRRDLDAAKTAVARQRDRIADLEATIAEFAKFVRKKAFLTAPHPELYLTLLLCFCFVSFTPLCFNFIIFFTLQRQGGG